MYTCDTLNLVRLYSAVTTNQTTDLLIELIIVFVNRNLLHHLGYVSHYSTFRSNCLLSMSLKCLK